MINLFQSILNSNPILRTAIQQLKTATGDLSCKLCNENIGDQGAKDLGLALEDSKLTSLTLRLDNNRIQDISTIGKGLEKKRILNLSRLSYCFIKI